MNRSAIKLPILLLLLLAGGGPTGAPRAQEAPAADREPLQLSLAECIREAFENNKEIRIASYGPELRENDFLFQKAQFDALLTVSGSYTDRSVPTNNAFDVGALISQVDPNQPFSVLRDQVLDSFETPIAIDSTQTGFQATYLDRLRIGSEWSADLLLGRSTSTSENALFPESYFSQLEFSFTQPLLRNFGRDVNEWQIVIASNSREADTETFRTGVQNMLLEVEDAYWTLVFAREDLEVKKEALRLAEELLKLNRIKVQVGTLPPIDITQAEAGVASREEDVIVAEASIESAEDRLRRALGMDPASPEWKRPILPTEAPTILERPVDLETEIKTAVANRTDLAAARLTLKSSEVRTAHYRNQLRYSLNANATYTLQGLSGDTGSIVVTNPFDPNITLGTIPPFDSGIGDAFDFIPKRDFPSYAVSVTLGIPIGNRAAEASYTNARLQRELDAVAYENFEQAAIVQVGTAVRRVTTDRKRIQAAEKNRTLQERKVEAEQKKFENGLSTSFQVLEFQKDLAEARSRENAAKKDYRVSLANLDLVTGVLDKSRSVRVEEYARN